MTSTLGTFALSFAVLISAAAAICSVAAARFDSAAFLRGARVLMGLAFAAITAASIALIVALVNSDFTLEYVAQYTERALPLGYKLAAFWAGQAGSLLLWAWILVAMGVVFAFTRYQSGITQTAATMAALAVVNLFFAALMLFAANPFDTLAQVPLDGRGLNPMLQDPGMIAHPPLLFLGYAGFTVPFAMLIGALIAGRSDNGWIVQTRRWAIFSWLTLSVGILLGAQWAYVELGWGGYWAWDPVENASLLPWLTGTALLHSIMAQQHRGVLKIWNASLIAATFVLCIFGTYLTRSGVIQSVHSFGQSTIGTFFLTFIIITVVFSAALIVARRRLLRSEHTLETLWGREGMFLATNVLLVGMTLVTLIGTIFPIISRTLSGNEVTVGPKFYNTVVAPLALLLVAVMAVGPLLTYGKDSARKLARGLIVPAILAAMVTAAFAILGVHNVWALICVAIATFVFAGIVIEMVSTTWVSARTTGENVAVALIRLIDGNHRRYGGQLVHVGMMMIVIGVTGSSVFSKDETVQFTPGQQVSVAGQSITFHGLHETRKANFTAVEAHVTLADPVRGTQLDLRPQRRFYDKAEDANSEVAIESNWKRDVYLTLAGWESGGAITAIQVRVNPLVSWLWSGGVVLTIGALFAMLPRLLPQRSERATSTEAKAESAPQQAPAAATVGHAVSGGRSVNQKRKRRNRRRQNRSVVS